MTVFVFGNPDVPEDSLPLRLVPRLQAAFPDSAFLVKDPNEEWDVPEHLVVLDTAVNVDRVMRFDSLKDFQSGPRVSVHDFDAYANLRLLEKIGKLRRIAIIVVPPGIDEDAAFAGIVPLLAGLDH